MKLMKNDIFKDTNFIKDIINSITDALLVLNKKREIVFFNDAAKEILKPLGIDDALHKQCSIVSSIVGCQGICPTLNVIKTGKKYTVEYPLKYPDGHVKTFLISASPLFDKNGEVEYCVELVRDISREKENESKVSTYTDMLEKKNENLWFLYDFVESTSQHLELEKMMKIALEKVMKITGFTRGTIHLLRDKRKVLQLIHAKNINENACKIFSEIPLGDGFLGKAAFDKKLHFIPRLGNLSYKEHLLSELLDIQSGIFIPLYYRDKTLGVLSLGHTKSVKLRPDDLEILITLGNSLSIAINNALLYNELYKKSLELLEENKKAQAANKLISEFIANISHELRSPLTGILTFVDVFKDEVYEDLPSDLQRLLDIMNESSQELLSKIDDLLDFSRSETGKWDLKKRQFDIDEVVKPVESLYRVLATQKGIKFHVNIPNTPTNVYSDPNIINQVLINLLNNAVKFTERGSIYLNVKKYNTIYCFEVIDTGIGISEDNQKIIFNKFMQIDSSLSRKYKGTGLGLSIAKNLVELLGGQIKVNSRIGVGSTFYFTIPQ